jgi:MtrB/PioB family decaheme-associated outer membrane protein
MFSNKFSFRALLGASVCLLPLLPVAAFAADDFDVEEKPAEAAAPPPSQNWITIGGQYNSGRSDYVNRFNGTEGPGGTAIGELHYGTRDAWDSGGTSYFNFSGDKLGTPDRTVSVRGGQQGTWGLSFGYDGIYYDGGHNYQSIYNTDGSLAFINPGSLAVGWTKFAAGSPTTAPYTVNPLWQPTLTAGPALTKAYQLQLQRDIYTLNGKYQTGDWTITSAWRHEHKEGYQPQSLTIAGKPSLATSSATTTATSAYTSGVMAYFLQPVNYDTDRFDLAAQYATRAYQAQLSYNFSQFQNNTLSSTLANPLALSSSTYGNPALIAPIYVLPPSNSAHQIKGQFATNLTPTTRLNVNVAYGVQVQNEALINGSGTPAVPNATEPAQNLQGFIETIYGNVALSSQPIKGLDLRLAYTIDNRDNETPRNVWISNTTSTAINATAASGYTYGYTTPNFPFTFRHQSLAGEAGYRLWGQTRLSVSDTLEDMYRSYGLSSDVETNRTTIKLRGPIAGGLFGSLSGTYEDRWAQNYNPNAIWNIINATAHADTTTDLSTFLAFFQSSRKHAEIKAMLDESPVDGLSISLIGKASRDTYPSNVLGMRNNRNLSIGPDVGWEVSKDLSLHAFYTYQQLYFDESALWQGGSGTSAYYVPFHIADTNSVQTAGVTADWKVIPNKLKVTFDAALSYGDTAYGLGASGESVGSAINSWATLGTAAVSSLPDVTSTLITIGVRGEYELNPTTTLMIGYNFERFNYKDYVNNIGATQYAGAFVPGTVNPNEAVHVISAAVRMRF